MSYGKKEGKRSPLERKPLRNPGESLGQEIERLLGDELVSIALIILLPIIFAFWEWFRWFMQLPPQPWQTTVAALPFIGYGVYRFIPFRRRLRDLQLGLEGEKYVGQALEELRSKGCHIFHDVQCDGFNIDHVVVSPHGIFAIETKTRSKPLRGSVVVRYDGQRVWVNGVEPDRNPIDQAHASRKWLRDFFVRETGRRYPVRGVVVFPGWFVEPSEHKEKDAIWVLNHEALPSFIEHEPLLLEPEDVALASLRLADHITR